MTTTQQYRPEIDGLRALSVLPVILFHSGSSSFEGGFVGVDVFFVISGYLITGIILNELDAKTFSLRTFYERRIRRIIPPLYLVLLACCLYSLMLSPYDMRDLGQSIVATVFFSENLLLWVESADYFKNDTEYKYLLHMWTLGVEEQFYLFFPAILLVLFANKKISFALVIAILAGLSFFQPSI